MRIRIALIVAILAAPATTDSAGRFTFTDLGPDTYSLRAHKLGFAPEGWDVELSKSSHVRR